MADAGATERRAESYLRHRAEEQLTSEEWDIPRRARTLLDVGALPPVVHASMLDGYNDARALRGLGDVEDDRPAAGPPLNVYAARPVELPSATLFVDWVATNESRTRVSVSAVRSGRVAEGEWPPHAAIHDGSPRKWYGWGSGNEADEYWHESSTEPGIDVSRPLTVAGHELQLIRDPDDVVVETTPVGAEGDPISNRAARYLVHLRRTSDPLADAGELALAIDTLIECDLVDAHERGAASGAGTRSCRPARRPSRGSRRSTTDSHPLGITAGFLTRQVTLLGLAETETGLQIDLFVQQTTSAPGGLGSVGADALAVRAVDDLGRRYAGRIETLGRGSGLDQGVLLLEPALTPFATRLDLFLETFDRTVMVSIPWPRP